MRLRRSRKWRSGRTLESFSLSGLELRKANWRGGRLSRFWLSRSVKRGAMLLPTPCLFFFFLCRSDVCELLREQLEHRPAAASSIVGVLADVAQQRVKRRRLGAAGIHAREEQWMDLQLRSSI